MTLRLSVVGEHGTRLGKLTSKVFGVHGGTIGRATDNDWSLPDPERYLSGKHARVDFRKGAYVLVDTSSNGVYVNGAVVPLGKYHDYGLKDGDLIRLGEYELRVTLEEGNDFPPDEGAIVAHDGQASSAVRKATADDLGAQLDVNELLDPGAESELAAAVSLSEGEEACAMDPEDPESPPATPWHLMTRPFKQATESLDRAALGAGNGAAPDVAEAALDGTAAATGATGAAPGTRPALPTGANGAARAAEFDAPAAGDVEAGFAAFCRGAGIEPQSLSAQARAQALQVAGQLLRESILGLMDLNQGRHDFRNHFRIPAPTADGPESPLNFSRGVDEALVRLLNTMSKRAGPVAAVRENFRELKAQHVASLAAMHAAFEDFLGRFDPKDLQERFERASKRGVFGTQNKAKYWDLYAEMFPGLAHRPADGYPHLFTEAFGKAYAAKLRLLVPPRRPGFGAGRPAAEPDAEAVGDV